MYQIKAQKTSKTAHPKKFTLRVIPKGFRSTLPYHKIHVILLFHYFIQFILIFLLVINISFFGEKDFTFNFSSLFELLI